MQQQPQHVATATALPAVASDLHAAITRHLVACADLLRQEADAAGLDRDAFNAMQAARSAGELAYQSAELRAQGRDEEADQYARWALLKLAGLTGRSILPETSAS